MNGDLIRELKNVIDSSEQIPQRAVNSLLLSSMVEIHKGMNEISSAIKELKQENQKIHDEVAQIARRIDDITCLSEEAMEGLSKLDRRVVDIEDEVRTTVAGPMHGIERWIRKYPKTAVAILLLLLMFLDARVIARLLLPFFAWLGVPPLTIQKLYEIFG